MNTIKKVTLFLGILLSTNIWYFAQTFAMEIRLSSAALGATLITSTTGSVTPAPAATSTAKGEPKALPFLTFADYTAKQAKERAELFISILEAALAGKTQEVLSAFKLAQDTEAYILRDLSNGLTSNPIDQVAVSRLGLYVTAQLEKLSENLVAERSAKTVDSIKQSHIGPQLAASAPATDRQFNRFAEGISRQAELFPAVVIAKKKVPFAVAWAKAERERMKELEKMDSQEKLTAEKNFLTLGIEIEIPKEKEKSPFLAEPTPSEKDASFIKGGSLGVHLIKALEEFGDNNDAASIKIYEKMCMWILEAIGGSLEDSIKFFKGFERTLFVLQPKKISNNREGMVTNRFQKWEEFAKKIIHAKTQDQLFYCILRTNIIFAQEQPH